jgi:hypothetical protein
VEKDFGVKLDDCIHIIVACYEQPDYDGYAFVLYKEGRKLYEVHGSHCSYYGLEDQWSPEETTLKEIRHRVKEGNLRCFMGGAEGGILKELESL